jgi:hypothetical protein
MKIEELYNHYDKNAFTIQTRLGIEINVLNQWLHKGYIPISAQMRIEEDTNGFFKANAQDSRPKET